MQQKIIFIDHHDNQQDDLAWTHIGDLGFDRQLARPFQGEQLDDPGEDVAGLIIYGGSHNVGETDKYPFLLDELRYIESSMAKDIPIIGICLGGQLIAHSLGGKVASRNPEECEFGYYPIRPTDNAMGWIPDPFYVTQAHFEEFTLPKGACCLASSERFENQAFSYGDNVIGLQFHPEVTAPIFKRWQNADWAMYDINGSQSKQQQDQLIDQHDALQGEWFKMLLQNFFHRNHQ